jgi:hypothetical protein
MLAAAFMAGMSLEFLYGEFDGDAERDTPRQPRFYT